MFCVCQEKTGFKRLKTVEQRVLMIPLEDGMSRSYVMKREGDVI